MLLRASVPLALLLQSSTCAAHDRSAYQPPRQSEWQKRRFADLSAAAAEQSRESVPELLAELDQQDFRRELKDCCPSSYNLTSAELLQKLTDEMATVEVVSGFFADSKAAGSVLSGMSVQDGMHGTFFHNVWAKVVLHNGSFESPSYVFGFANRTDASDDGHYTAWLWKNLLKSKSRKCEDEVEWKLPLVVDKCIHGGDVNVGNATYGASLNASGLVIRMWTSKLATVQRLPGGVAQLDIPFTDHLNGVNEDTMDVPCPRVAPQYEFIVPTQTGCHPILFGHSDFFYEAQDKAETKLYGLKAFAKPARPTTLQEASERGFYSLVNTFLLDSGSPLFGDVSAVFSSQAIKKAALVSAVDTGFQTLQCNSSSPEGPAFNLPHNCSAFSYATGLGTLEHFYHLLLANHRFWKPLPSASPLARMLARMEGRWGSGTLGVFDLTSYLEIVPAGSLLLPNDIRFLIGNFPALFGTTMGEQLREWAAIEGWMLLWSLGLNVDDDLNWIDIMDFRWLSIAANTRLIDPIAARNTSATRGLPLDNSVLQEFSVHWEKVKALRSDAQGNISNTTWRAQWNELKGDTPSGLHIGPVRPGAGCPNPSETVPDCIGITSTGVCVCYASENSLIFV